MIKVSEARSVSQMPRHTPLLDFHHSCHSEEASRKFSSSLDVNLESGAPQMLTKWCPEE